MSETHVDRADNPCTDGMDVWTMWCGEQVLILPNGEMIPEEVDFYSEKWAHKASCQACKAAFARRLESLMVEHV